MHRTVFEFLNDLSTWELDCLQIHDKGYEPNTYLAEISLQLFIARRDEYDYMFIEEALLYTIQADKSVRDTNCPIVHFLTKLGKTAQIRLAASLFVKTDTGLSPVYPYVALESGMIKLPESL